MSDSRDFGTLSTRTARTDVETNTAMFGIHKLPVDCFFVVLDFLAQAHPHSILAVLSVCSRWRTLTYQHKGLCARIVWKFSTAEPIIFFLEACGDTCQNLDFDYVRSLTSIKDEDLARILQLMHGQNRLRNANVITSTLSFPQSRWFSRLRAVKQFSHLRSLSAHLSTLDELPLIKAPNLTTLSLKACQQSYLSRTHFIHFLRGLPKLKTLTLRKLGCHERLGGHDQIAQVPSLESLTMFSIRRKIYRCTRDVLRGTPPSFCVYPSLDLPIPLREFWPSSSLRQCTRLAITMRPFELGAQLIVADSDYRPTQPYRFLTDTPFSAQPHFVQKAYYTRHELDLVDVDLLDDANSYAHAVNEVTLEALPHDFLGFSQWALPSQDDLASMRLTQWLRELHRPTHLSIDAHLSTLFREGPNFIWPSLRQITIVCSQHIDSDAEHDQLAVNAVADWIILPVFLHRLDIKLAGRKWDPDDLSVDTLRSRCARLEDYRVL